MTSDALSIRLDADTLNGLGRLVIELNRSREDLIKDAVDFENGDYVTHRNAWLNSATRTLLEAVDMGPVGTSGPDPDRRLLPTVRRKAARDADAAH